jgi:hypothetical protein
VPQGMRTEQSCQAPSQHATYAPSDAAKQSFRRSESNVPRCGTRHSDERSRELFLSPDDTWKRIIRRSLVPPLTERRTRQMDANEEDLSHAHDLAINGPPDT